MCLTCNGYVYVERIMKNCKNNQVTFRAFENSYSSYNLVLNFYVFNFAFFFFLNGHIILIYVKLNITREICHQIMIWPQKFYSILNVITSRISLPRSVQYQYYWKFNCYTITHETLTFLDHNSINFWSIFPYVIKGKLFCLLQFSRTSMIFFTR